jgi:hypothetical protein
VRWLIVKDLQILRRSPLLVGLLVVYPIAIALMIGFAISSPPGKPTVAYYSGVKAGHGRLRLGSQRLDIAAYAHRLFESVHALRAGTPAAAIADVREGRALAALIVPADLTAQIDSLIRTGAGNPTIRLVLNDRNPLERALAQQAIDVRVNQVEQAVSRQVLKVAIEDLGVVLDGGTINFVGQDIPLLGLRDSRTIVQAALDALRGDRALAPALRQVIRFADLAIEGLSFASPVLNQIGRPLTVEQTQLSGATTPSASYAVAIAAVVSLMFVALLLAAGLLALERSEHAYRRLVRGLVAPEALLGEKIVLAGVCSALVTLAMAAVVSSFIPLQWGRFELWALALLLAGLAFGALGVALGAVAREVSSASLLAVLCSLPVAFLALIPASAVSGGVATALDVVSFVFPFRAGLQAVTNAFSAAAPGMGGALVHLAVLALVFAGLARLALVRFASG